MTPALDSKATVGMHRTAVGLLGLVLATALPVAAFAQADPSMETRINELIPRLETYITEGMKAYDNPGLAIGIVSGDKLVYAKGFGTRTKGGEPVDTRTVFQIGSATKAFLATTMAIAVDRGGFKWDDRLIDLDPDFQMKDAWVTREMRMFDIIAQRSGMPALVNDAFGLFGFDEPTLIRSLRYVDPVTSFRSTFAYTNITHLEAGRVVAKVVNAADWRDVLQKELFDPLGMTESSDTAAAIEAGPNHAVGHRWEPTGTVEVPFTEVFPYAYKGAGSINSNVEDMAHWLRLQLGNGTFEGKQIVSPGNLAVTRQARVAVSDKAAYAMGWVLYTTPNGVIIWHNGGTASFGSYVGFQPERGIAVVVLTNEENQGFPDAIGLWVLDRLMGNPEVDHVAERLKGAKAGAEAVAQLFARPANPRPAPDLAPLAGSFTNPAFGKAVVKQEGDALSMSLETGATLKIEPWDGDVFTATLLPTGPLAAMAENLGPRPIGFVQFQMDDDGRLNLMRLTTPEDNTSREFRRE